MLMEVISYHHKPSPRRAYFPMISAVHLADYLARNLGFTDSYRQELPPFRALALDGVGMEKADLVRAAKTLQSRAQAIVTLWKEMIETSQNQS
jgi:HD-like signal output (HDOD) protein